MTALEWTARLFRRGTDTTAAVPGTSTYLMRRRIALAHDDIPIENEEGVLAFSVDGEAMRLGRSLIVRDSHSNPLYRIPERTLHLKEFMEIERGEGGTAATVRRTKLGNSRDRWTVTLHGPRESRAGLHLRGSVADYEYRIVGVDRQVAEVSKRWFRLRNTYGVAIPPAEDEALILTIVAAVDQMAH
jgi:uncharacterized protein YxjI